LLPPAVADAQLVTVPRPRRFLPPLRSSLQIFAFDIYFLAAMLKKALFIFDVAYRLPS